MSNYTHELAVKTIYNERREALDHHRQYFERVVAKLRELKLRQALGEVSVHKGGGYTQKIVEAIVTERGQLRYARDCVRRARRAVWELNRLQRSLRKRVQHDF